MKERSLSEEEQMRQTLQKRASAQNVCVKADIDVKLRRALLSQFRGLEVELPSGERCLYWRESNNKFHTIRWRGPAVVVAVQRGPDTGQVSCFWLAHVTVLIRTGRQHVQRLLDSEGRMASAAEALEGLRQRRVVRMLDLNKVNPHQFDELNPHEDLDDSHDGSLPGDARDVKMRVHPSATPALPDPGKKDAGQQDAASDGYAPGTFIDDTMEFEDALQDPPQDAPQPVQPDTEPNEDLPPIPDAFESADEEELPDQAPTQDPQPTQPTTSAAASSQPLQQPETFAQRRQRMDYHETDWLRHPAFKHKSDAHLESTNPKRRRSNQEQAFTVDVFNLEDKTSIGGMQSWLPDGWTYDAKLNEFQLGDW
eukprot:s1590_g22.t1